MKGGARNQPAAAASQQHQPVPPSPTTKGTAKYTNKDGSKFITVPKIATPVEASQPSPTTSNASGPQGHASQAGLAGANGPAPAPVNRKKQKRRAKAAAKAAAEAGLSSEHPNGLPSPAASTSHGSKHLDAEPADESDDEDEHFHDSHHHIHGQGNGYADPSSKSKKSKKKKKKGSTPGPVAAEVEPPHQHVSSPPPNLVHRGSGISKEKIWNTSSQEERERIKEFWLGLGEDERKSLVKVEKDAVLKKMKEQQKHTCSCTVCGRKRTAIEEELEGLYDAYYEELEQFANHPHQHGDPPMMGSSRNFGLHANRSLPGSYSGHQPSRGRIVEHVGDDDEDDDGEEEYSEDDLDDDEYSDEEPEEIHRDYATDFFNFGNSLTVQGGILTVADDLLKNDGKKFIEMMEQLAERRMAREEDAKEQAYPRAYGHNINGGNLLSHNHPPPPPVDEDDYEEEDEDEEEYDESQEDEYDEEEDTMTEEQRMEEGRRMFQIFAARMFEQRVLTAYREKVAKERQQKLLEELDEETRQDSQRKAKKAKEAQKRKEKAAQKKAALAEEKARKEAEKAAEIEARLQQEAARAEEARLKAEEKRKKKEAQKKAEEEERLRKEAERQRRIHEQKERQAEQERKAREAKEREKRARDDAKLKEQEARDRKEREVRERHDKPSELDKRNKDVKTKPEREAKDKQRQDEKVAQKVAALSTSVPITLPKRPSQHQSNPVPVLPQQPPAAFASPQIAVATPALPKAPTPIRPRQASQQDISATGSHPGSQAGSGTSQNASPSASTPVHRSPAASGISGKSGSLPTQPAQAMSPLQSAAKLPSTSQPGPFNMPPIGMAFPPGLPQQMPPGFGNRMHHDPMFPPIGAGFRPGPNMMPMPPGLNGPMNGRGFPIPHPPPGFPQATPDQLPGPFPGSLPKDSVPPTHSRQPSGGFDAGPGPATQPISRPAPIGRPGSVVHGQRPASESPASAAQKDFDDLQSHHLGSSALLDDSDEPLLPSLPDFGQNARRGTAAPGPARPGFPPAPFGGMDPATLFHTSSLWGHPSQPPPGINPFGAAPPPPPGFGPTAWASPTPAFSGPGGIGRPSQPRSVTIRQMLCRVCRDLSEKSKQTGSVNSTPDGSKKSDSTSDGFISLDAIKSQVDLLNTPNERPVSEDDLLALCETEGNMQNGGGSFDVREDGPHRFIRWVPSMNNGIGPDGLPHLQRAVGAPGEIGSPVIGSGWGR